MPMLNSSWNPSSAYQVLAATSSEAASTRPKPLTPMIAGSVCGGVMGIAWIVGFTIYFIKRYRRKKLNRQVAAGIALPKQKQTKLPDEKIIIPPDPAILLGNRLPGESAFREDVDARGGYHPKSESTEPSAPLDNMVNSTTNNPLASEKSPPPH